MPKKFTVNHCTYFHPSALTFTALADRIIDKQRLCLGSAARESILFRALLFFLLSS